MRILDRNQPESDTIKHLRAVMPSDGGIFFVGTVNDATPFALPDHLDEAAEHARSIGTDVYLTPGRFKPDASGELKRNLDCAIGARVAWVDVDDWTAESETGYARLREALGGAVFRTRTRENRFHVYVRLTEVVEPDRLKTLNQGLVALLGGDPSPVHAASWMRLVGTHNSKAALATEPDGSITYGGSLVEFSEPPTDDAVTPNALAAVLPEPAVKEPIRPAADPITSRRNNFLIARFGALRNQFDDEAVFLAVCRIVGETEISNHDGAYPAERIAEKARWAWSLTGAYHRDDLAVAVALTASPARAANGRYAFDAPTELEEIYNGTYEPPRPAYLQRNDGRALFYASAINYVWGEDSVGKTWVELATAIDVMRRGGVVVHLDWDDGYATNVYRLKLLGATYEEVRDRYRHRTEPGALTAAEATAVLAEHPDLILVDVVANALAARGLREDLAGDYLAWATETAIPWARSGAGVILADHVTKAGDRHDQPRATSAKRAGVDGVAYEVTAPKPLAKDQGGVLALTIHKDRHGGVGRRGDVAARLLFSPEMDLRVEVPDEVTARKPRDIAWDVVRERPGELTRTELGRAVEDEPDGPTRKAAREAVLFLVRKKLVTEAEVRRSDASGRQQRRTVLEPVDVPRDVMPSDGEASPETSCRPTAKRLLGDA